MQQFEADVKEATRLLRWCLLCRAPFPAVSGRFGPFDHGPWHTRRGPECPKMAQKAPKTGPVTPGSGGYQKGIPPFPTRQLPTANRESPTTINRQPTTTNHQPPPTANRQPTTRSDGPKPGQKSIKKFPTVVPDPWEGSNGLVGPFWACLDPFSAVLARYSPVSPPGLETVMGSNRGPKPVKDDFFQKWPWTLWEGQTDLSGPFWACFDQLYVWLYRVPHTGYWTPVHPPTPPLPHRIPVRETGKIQPGPKTSQK